jgi:ammonia channel protein AmtB
MKSGSDGALAAQVAMNTTLAAATGGITVFLLRYVIMHKYDVGALCNGILAGLVSITAGCGNMESGSAVATGLIGGGPVQQFNRVPGYPQYILILDPLILKPDGSTCNC